MAGIEHGHRRPLARRRLTARRTSGAAAALAALAGTFMPVSHVAARPAARAAPPPVVAQASAAGSDDAEEFAANGAVSLTSSDLELVDADEGAGQTVGLRFPGLALPQGAVVTSAWVQFTVDEVQSGPTTLTIAGHDIDQAPTFRSSPRDLTSRERTTARATWQPAAWTTVGSAGTASRTPDLSVVLQELVERPGWNATSPVALIITGSGQRTAVSTESPLAASPRLQVEYTPPPPPTVPVVNAEARVTSGADDAEEFPTGIVTRSSGDLELVEDTEGRQTVGLRFSAPLLPPGAEIVRSWIQFTADEAQEEPTTLVIRGHDSDNAPRLGPNNTNISGRHRTAASVTWSPPPWTTVGQAGDAQRTPDLSALIQEIVARRYWSSAGALAFTISGIGHRTAVAFDQNPAAAPVLRVDYRAGTPGPAPEGQLRLAVVGDYGNGGPGAGRVAALVDGLEVDAVVTTGDNSYGTTPLDENVGRHYQAYLGGYHGSYGVGSPANRFFPTLGNHDYSDGGGLPAYLEYFDLPGPGTTGTGRTSHERYYDVVLGPVHVFVVNSNPEEPDGITDTSAQADWLRDALAASTTPWQIVTFHHPPYSSGSRHGPTEALRWPFASWGADLVLNGHEHSYERLEVDGIPYIVNGLGGVSRYPAGGIDPRSARFFDGDEGALLIEACPGRLDLSFHTVDSGVIDTRRVGGPACSIPPVVTLEVADGTAAEPGTDSAGFVVRRSGPTAEPLEVSYTVSGTATAGTDYTALPGRVTIPAGSATAAVPVVALDDPAVEPDETVTAALVDSEAYDLGDPFTGAVTVGSDDVLVQRDVVPTGQQRFTGTLVSGSLSSLATSDDGYEVLREATVGSGSRRSSRLEYRWTFSVPANQGLALVVEGHHSVNAEGDDMAFEWWNGRVFQPLATVVKTADDDVAQVAALPSATTGTVTIRVRDTNQSSGRRALDTVSIDHLVLRTTTVEAR